MSRMSREFSLVLIGAGILTAGYFMMPDQDLDKRAEEQARQRVGGHRSGGHGMLLFVHTGGGGAFSKTGGARGAMMGSVSRGGFGSIGGRVSGGGGGGGGS